MVVLRILIIIELDLGKLSVKPVELKKNSHLKGYCSLDIDAITLASNSFNSRHVQIYVKFYLTEIDLSVLELRYFP